VIHQPFADAAPTQDVIAVGRKSAFVNLFHGFCNLMESFCVFVQSVVSLILNLISDVLMLKLHLKLKNQYSFF
jgi:hypothetical protein